MERKPENRAAAEMPLIQLRRCINRQVFGMKSYQSCVIATATTNMCTVGTLPAYNEP